MGTNSHANQQLSPLLRWNFRPDALKNGLRKCPRNDDLFVAGPTGTPPARLFTLDTWKLREL